MAKILIIEDDDIVRSLIRRVLEKHGHEVKEAADGREGVHLFRTDPVDLIITDIIMPHKEGLETIRELVATNPDVKIIAISGGGRVSPYDYLEMAEKFGAAKTFEKPFEWEELIEAIDEILGN